MSDTIVVDGTSFPLMADTLVAKNSLGIATRIAVAAEHQPFFEARKELVVHCALTGGDLESLEFEARVIGFLVDTVDTDVLYVKLQSGFSRQMEGTS